MASSDNKNGKGWLNSHQITVKNDELLLLIFLDIFKRQLHLKNRVVKWDLAIIAKHSIWVAARRCACACLHYEHTLGNCIKKLHPWVDLKKENHCVQFNKEHVNLQANTYREGVNRGFMVLYKYPAFSWLFSKFILNLWLSVT